MTKLGPTGVKILKIIHLFFAILWIGGGLALIALLFTTSPTSGGELLLRSRVLQIVDNYMIIPGAMMSLVTGLVYSIWTNWGFFKHNWITVKWVLTVVQVLFGALILGPWIDENVIIATQLGEATINNELFMHNVLMSQIWGTLQVILLLSFLFISVLKPWRKKRRKKSA